jgi:hypothetical protein
MSHKTETGGKYLMLALALLRVRAGASKDHLMTKINNWTSGYCICGNQIAYAEKIPEETMACRETNTACMDAFKPWDLQPPL